MSETGSEKKGFTQGVKQGLGFLNAVKEAIEETINEARERGDLSPDRAKEIMRSAVDRAQDAAEQARDRFDFVSRKEFDELVERVEAVAARVGMPPRPAATETGTDDAGDPAPGVDPDRPAGGPENPVD